MRRLSAIVTAGMLAGLFCAGTTMGASAGVTDHIVQPGPVAGALVPGAPAAASGTGFPTITGNWSGYAAFAPAKFTYVHSTFTEPKIACPGVRHQMTSNWVGLGGLTSQTVEQDGTFASCGGTRNKTPRYDAWYDMAPAASVRVFAVHAGDKMSVTVDFAKGKFTLTVADLTSGKKATHAAACSTCARNSAEWIIERPLFCTSLTSCSLTELADYHTTTMSTNQARAAGGKLASMASFGNFPIYMIQPLKSGGFISLDTVSPLTSSSAFTATWYRPGSVTPVPVGPRQ
jgi:peptidase A4-like protein